jgi:hypothetical protein
MRSLESKKSNGRQRRVLKKLEGVEKKLHCTQTGLRLMEQRLKAGNWTGFRHKIAPYPLPGSTCIVPIYCTWESSLGSHGYAKCEFNSQGCQYPGERLV